MDSLVDDELLLVFAHLDQASRVRLERVCRRWRALLRRLWLSERRLDLHSLLYRSPLFVNDLGYDCQRRDRAMDAILRLSGPSFTSLTLGPFDTSRHLHSPVERIQTYPLSQEMLNSIAIHATNLRRLSLAGHSFPSVSFIRKLFNSLNLETMEQLNLDFARIDTNNQVDGYEGAKILRKGLEQMTCLKSFSMRGRGTCFGYLHIDENFLGFLPSGLQELSISAGVSLKIKSLDFVKRLRSLTHLDIERSNIRSLLPLVETCGKLSSLNVAFCKSIADFGLIGRLSELRSLVLDGNREHLDNLALEKITNGCPRLRRLSLECCARLTCADCLSHQGLKSISRLVEMEHLSVAGNLGVEDGFLSEVALHCTRLRSLSLKGCRKLGGPGLLLCLSNLSSLTHIYVNMLPEFDEAVFKHLLVSLPKLKYVEALDCAVKMSARTSSCVLVASLSPLSRLEPLPPCVPGSLPVL